MQNATFVIPIITLNVKYDVNTWYWKCQEEADKNNYYWDYKKGIKNNRLKFIIFSKAWQPE